MESYEGLQESIPDLQTPTIESWEFQYPNSSTTIKVEIPEFTCVCPKTGQPDFAKIVIVYQPISHCLELKSLKLYIQFFRTVGIFHEHVVNRMLQDFAKACHPQWMEVTGIFNSRGGIQTTAVSRMGEQKGIHHE